MTSERYYRCCYYIGDENGSFEYPSRHRNGSKQNMEDLMKYARLHLSKHTVENMEIVQTYMV